MSLVNVTSVTKQYTKNQNLFALKDINFSLEKGQILGLIGINGSGKSTLIKCLLGEHKYSGSILINGYNPLTQRAELMESLSCISDINVLPRWIKIKQLFSYIDGVQPKFNIDKAYQMLSNTKINANQKIRSLSKGMKAQLYMLIVVCCDTKLVILDEPTLGLDLVNQQQFYSHVRNCYQKEQRTFIIASHDVAEIEHLLTDILVLNQGKIRLNSSMENIYNNYTLFETDTSVTLEQLENYSPILLNQKLNSTQWIVSNKDIEALKKIGMVEKVRLVDLILAIQKESQF